MGITAIITFAATFAVFQYFSSSAPASAQFRIIGGQYLSDTEMIRQVTTLKQDFYWVGQVDQSNFTAAINSDGVAMLFYWPAGTSAKNFNTPRRIVRTYENLAMYVSEYHPLNPPDSLASIEMQSGKMQYSTEDMYYQTFFLNNGKIVEVHYSTIKTPSEMLTQAALLTKIS
jgi:hypothetical protein